MAIWEGFEPFSIYRCIDIHKEGYITASMLQKYLLRKTSENDWSSIIESILNSVSRKVRNFSLFILENEL